MNKTSILWLFGISIAILIIVALGLNPYSLHFHEQLLSGSCTVIMILGISRDDMLAEKRLLLLMVTSYIISVIIRDPGLKDVAFGIGTITFIAYGLKRSFVK
jgi:hypothetical protein